MDGKAVGFAKVVVGATVIVLTAFADETIEADLTGAEDEAAAMTLTEPDEALTVGVDEALGVDVILGMDVALAAETSTAKTVAVPTLTPSRGDDEPPTLTPKSVPDPAVEEAFTLVEETLILLFKVELVFAEVTARATKASVRGAVMARPRKRVLRVKDFMMRLLLEMGILSRETRSNDSEDAERQVE